jgi:uncharacterized membrane protein
MSSNLVVIGFDDENKAFELRAELGKLQKEYLIDMEDVVVVTKDDKGKVKLHQAVNLTAAQIRSAQRRLPKISAISAEERVIG